MVATRPVQFIEELANRVPSLAERVGRLGDFYNRKLWHQLTVELQSLVDAPEMQTGDLLVQLYDNFVSDFALKLNLLKLAAIAVKVSKKYPTPQGAISFLETTIARLFEDKQLKEKAEQPATFLRMHIAELHLFLGDLPACKALVNASLAQLEAGGGREVEPSVAAAVYRTASLLHKAKQEYADFYRSALTYLAYADLGEGPGAVPQSDRAALALDIGLAALLGEGVYGFGELVLHPITASLEGGEYEWLKKMLVAFDAGDIKGYDSICAAYAPALNAQPALVAHERDLRRKVTVMALLELARSAPPEDRTLPLEVVARQAGLDRDGAEHLVMRCLSDHLIEGTIDGIEGVVRVTWVQPRILGPAQVAQLRDWIGDWIGKVEGTQKTVEDVATLE